MYWSEIIGDFYSELRRRRLLEEVDVDSLEYSLLLDAPSESRSTSDICNGGMVTAGYVAAAAALLTGQRLLAGAVSGAATSYLCAVGISRLLCRRVLSRLCASLDDSLSVPRQLKAVLKNKESISLGLGLHLTFHQLRYRLRVVLAVRSLVARMAEAADQLVQGYSLPHEQDRLLSTFYSPEIEDLMSNEIAEESPQNSIRCLETLLDLAVLHRSELARLLVLSMREVASSREQLSLLLRARRLSVELEAALLSVKSLMAPLRSDVQEESRARCENRVTQANPLRLVADALRDVADNIDDGVLDATGAESVLRRVLAMDAFPRQHRPVEAPVRSCEVIERTTVVSQPRLITDRQPIVDQVFEAFAPSDVEDSDGDCDYEFNMPTRDVNLLGELRGALDGRAAEFAQRERKALASFYGLTEQEMEEKERQEKNMDEELRRQRIPEKTELDGMGLGVEGGGDWVRPERPTVPLAAELLKALAARQQAAETTIGDSDSE